MNNGSGIEYMNRRPRNPLFIKAHWFLYEPPVVYERILNFAHVIYLFFHRLGINNDDFSKQFFFMINTCVFSEVETHV
jgi:hypothetical protein